MYVKLLNVILLVINCIGIIINIKLWYDKTKDDIKNKIFSEKNERGWQI